MRRRRASLASGESSSIDLAPMLDFVLNLLIFFIITAVFTKELGLSMARPGSSAGSGPSESLPISIGSDGEIRVEGRVVDLRAVRANVERMSAEKPGSGVLILADRDARTGVVTQVVDQVHLGGTDDITFGTN